MICANQFYTLRYQSSFSTLPNPQCIYFDENFIGLKKVKRLKMDLLNNVLARH